MPNIELDYANGPLFISPLRRQTKWCMILVAAFSGLITAFGLFAFLMGLRDGMKFNELIHGAAWISIPLLTTITFFVFLNAVARGGRGAKAASIVVGIVSALQMLYCVAYILFMFAVAAALRREILSDPVGCSILLVCALWMAACLAVIVMLVRCRYENS